MRYALPLPLDCLLQSPVARSLGGARGYSNLAGLALLSFSLCVAWVFSGSCSCKWSACNSLCWRNRLPGTEMFEFAVDGGVLVLLDEGCTGLSLLR
jgi:hypothetical protein